MSSEKLSRFISNVLKVMPKDWIELTTHRLDIYNEKLAKVEFLQKFEKLDSLEDTELEKKLLELPTAFDYIRLGHPLSCILEWLIAKELNVEPQNIISFSSKTMPILAVLRKNLISNINTRIIYHSSLPVDLDLISLRDIYGYKFELVDSNDLTDSSSFNGTTLTLTSFESLEEISINNKSDIIVSIHEDYGSVTCVKSSDGDAYISEIQHVRRRESVAMTPNDCLCLLQNTPLKTFPQSIYTLTIDKIKEITSCSSEPLLASSGLSMQYAIMMGLIDSAQKEYPDKSIKFLVPPNCYGGTNDQARRVAACIDSVDVVDLSVDGDQDMVQSLESVLDQVSKIDAIAFIIAEIPTNPRVEVPDLKQLQEVLTKKRYTEDGVLALDPVFILDQTFCPNTRFLSDVDVLSSVKVLSYVSGSKFPSGGLCTAGYCVSNAKADSIMSLVAKHLEICDNQATHFQVDILSKQLPSMNSRIKQAYINTREFVSYIEKELPQAKINFVSTELALSGFTPSVFSLDLPTKGETAQIRESYKRSLNLDLIAMMIEGAPSESKHCVSYGQLKGCYWTIPATSTQGTTKEGDKDYIVRVSIAPDFDLELHKKIFKKFCQKHF